MDVPLSLVAHSVVGLVTNSSSETYSFVKADAVDKFKGMVDAILRAAGSEKTCDDLFVVELERKQAYYLDEMLSENYEDIQSWTSHPDGIFRLKVTAKPGVELSEDLGLLIDNLVDAEEFGWG